MDKKIIKEILKEMFRNKEIEIVQSEDIHYNSRYSVLSVLIDGEQVYENREFVEELE